MSKLTELPAWQLLTDNERTALSLALGHEKSTWEAGEVIGKSHYKYLEIASRAKHFLKIFTEYFNLVGVLIPPGVPVSEAFQEYIRLTIGNRLKVKDAVLKMQYQPYIRQKSRNDLITEDIKLLVKSNARDNIAFLRIIMEFDKWNNFRILSPDVQEPTAFKRRNKHKNRKLIRFLYNINPLIYERLLELFQIKQKLRGVKYYYIPLINPKTKKAETATISVQNIKYLSGIGIFVFETEIEAGNFAGLIVDYMIKEFRHCRDGQIFWPKFRRVVEKSKNYLDIQNISVHRRNDFLTAEYGKIEAFDEEDL